MKNLKFLLTTLAIALMLFAPVSSNSVLASEISDGDIDIPATIIDSFKTTYSEETPCQVNCKAIIPDNFGMNCTIEMFRVDTEDDPNDYRVVLYPINDYADRIFLAEGVYAVWVHIPGDNTGQFPLDFPTEIELKADEVFLLEAKLTHYDEIAADIAERLGTELKTCVLCGSVLDSANTCTNKDCSSVTANNEVEEQAPIESNTSITDKNPTTVIFDHAGTSEAIIYATGTQTTEYNIVVEIIKSGAVSEAVYKLSLDGGQTYSEDTVLPLSGVVVLNSTGLALNFQGTFEEGDVYTAWFRNLAKDITVINQGDGYATVELLPTEERAYTYDIMYANKYLFRLEIKKDGAPGEAVFVYSLNNGEEYSEEMYIPEDGVYIIGDTGLKIVFNAPNNETFKRGDVYYVYLNYPEEQSYTSLYILLAVISIAVIVVFVMLLGKKKKDSEYNLQKYQTPEQ